ncbi:MAG: hypothetical protein WBM69_17920 [Desulfobacterales bacterium]
MKKFDSFGRHTNVQGRPALAEARDLRNALSKTSPACIGEIILSLILNNPGYIAAAAGAFPLQYQHA